MFRSQEIDMCALRLWWAQCYEVGDFVRLSSDETLDPEYGEWYESYRIPADKFDHHHPYRLHYWDVDVYRDGHVQIHDAFYEDSHSHG